MKKVSGLRNTFQRAYNEMKPFLRFLIYRNWRTIRKNRIALGKRVRIVGRIQVMNDREKPGSISIGDCAALNSHYRKANPSATICPVFFA